MSWLHKLKVGESYTIDQLRAGKIPTYYTCFCFQGQHPKDLHITHKYLGPLNDSSVIAVKTILDDFFYSHFYLDRPFKMPFNISFKNVEYFGQNKDVRVLRPNDLSLSQYVYFFMPDLKKALDPFRADDFPAYQPHVTTNLDIVELPVIKYALMKDETILIEYK